MTPLCHLLLAAASILPQTPSAEDGPRPDAAASAPSSLTVMAWNIWHGGREDGDEVGPQRVTEVIRSSGADVVAMQETYGSGELISNALGFHFHPRGTNVSIHSRFPVVEDLSVHEPFQCVGALLELPDKKRVAFYSIWLPYSAEIWAAGTRKNDDPEAMLAACEASRASLTAMHLAIEARLDAPEYEGVPVIIAGDFNSMSPLDYGEVGTDQYGVVLDWPTGHILPDAGFRDAYRESHPALNRELDRTWTPRFPEQEQDRIDFVFYRGAQWQATSARVIDTHPDGFPSDHAALVATFGPRPTPTRRLRAATYNIRHGVGMDGSLDLDRTAKALRALDADVIALQEVDLGAERSGGVHQVNELAARLGMHPAFGTFMPYGGGRYGMAMLSRHPYVDVRSLRLPDGNEPRVALLADLRLPCDEVVRIAGVHFDWVADDAYRWAQANRLIEDLGDCAHPFVVLGDFNDGPRSRTLRAFRDLAVEVKKPDDARFTFPADAPSKEIDFLFHSKGHWETTGPARVHAEPMASDHRPVAADLVLRDTER